MPGSSELRNALLNITNRDPVYNTVADALAPSIQKLVAQLGEQYKIAMPSINNDVMRIIAGDSYFTWYSMLPLVRRERLEPAIVEGWRQFLRNVVGSEEWRVIHSVTKLDPVKSAAMATLLARRFLAQLVDEVEAKAPLANVKPEDALQRLFAGGNCPLSQKIAEKAAAKAATAFIQEVRKDGEKLRRLLSEIAEIVKAAKEQQKQVQARGSKEKGEGGGRGGSGAGTKPGELALAAQVAQLLATTNLEQIVVLGGKIEARFRFWRSQRRESRRGQPNGYTVTSNPAKALPREHALPTELWLAKLASGKWLTRRKMEEKLGMLIVAVDKSGSMAGKPSIWARSVAYALLKLAAKRRQPIALLFFDARVYDPYTDLMQALEAIAKVANNGGTCIDCAIEKALELLERHKDKANTIVLITDGEDEVRTQPEELKKRGARLVAVMINGDNETLAELAKASGGQYLRAELTEDDALKIVDAAL